MSFGRRPPSPDSSETRSEIMRAPVQPSAPETPRALIYSALATILLVASILGVASRIGGLMAKSEDTPEEIAAAKQPFEADVSRLKRFPNVTVTYYDVPGTDLKAIFDYIEANGPLDSTDGSRGHGNTAYQMRWQYPGSTRGCDAAHVKVSYSATVLLPRLTESEKLTPKARKAWSQSMASLIAHEEMHLHLSYGHTETMAQAIRRAGCANARTAADEVFARINARNVEFDRETQHGLVKSAKFPLL